MKKYLLMLAAVLFASPVYAITGEQKFDGDVIITGDLLVGGNLTYNDSGAAKTVRFEGDTDANLVYIDGTNDRFGIGTSSPQVKGHVAGAFRTDGATVLNENGSAVDTRIESDNDSNMIMVDGTNDRVGIGTAPASGPFIVESPGAQTIAAGNTVSADACGSIKKITSAGGVTTDTTNTFTSPLIRADCCMDVINVGAQAITLDNNALFASAGAGDVVLGANDTVRVCSNGAVWFQIGATGNN